MGAISYNTEHILNTIIYYDFKNERSRAGCTYQSPLQIVTR